MDKDEKPIGGLRNPMQPTKQLFWATVVMDAVAVASSFFVSVYFAIAICIYIVCSRLYSYRPIRLKQYAIIGYLVVVINQGALTFFMVYHGASGQTNFSAHGMLAAAFLIGGFYPITQIYQHESDAKDGVKTVSMLLGKKGTMIWCAFMYIIAFSILADYYFLNDLAGSFFLLHVFFVPVLVFFIRWMLKIWRNESTANFKHTMQMNWLASTCTSLAFITLIVKHQLG